MLPPLFLQTPKDESGEIDVNPDAIINKLDSILDGFVRILPNIGIAIIVFIFFFFVARGVKALVSKVFHSRGRSNLGEVLGGFLKWVVLVVGIGICMTIVSPNLKFADLIAGLGVSSVAIGFAFKDILQNWMAGLLILMRQPFEIGDEIEVEGAKGVVDRIETRATSIIRYDGQEVVIPNSTIYTSSVRVITSNQLIRSQYDIGVGYDQDYQKAIEVIRKTLNAIEGVSKDKPIDILPWDQADSWLNIRMRWWTDSSRGSVVKTYSEVIIKTQEAMDDAGIDLPFQTVVEVKNAHNVVEGQEWEKQIKKEEAKAKKEAEKTASKSNQGEKDKKDDK